MIFRSRPVRATVAGLLAFATTGALTQASFAAPADDQVPPKVSAHAEKDSNQRVNVVVILKAQPGSPSAATEKQNLAGQEKLISGWKDKYQLEVHRRFGYLVNGFSASIPANKMVALQEEKQVASVKREKIYQPVENSARVLEGVPAAAKKYSVDGTGMLVSIIDSGIDPQHQDMRLDDCGTAKIKKIDPAKDAHFNCKVPTGHNYADENDVVKDLTASQHGMHVAGIVAANGSEGSGPDAKPGPGRIDGVAPNAQLLAMKVFSNKGDTGAKDSDIIAAIEDSVRLGADVINMSLGSPNGQYDASDGAAMALEKAQEAGVINVIAAGNEGLNFSPTGATDDEVGVLDDGTLGNPGSNRAAFTVASMDNSAKTTPQAFISSDKENGFSYLGQTGEVDGKEHPVVFVGFGQEEDYTDGQDLTGKYALIERGKISFADKFQAAVDHGAEGVVVFNSEAGGDDLGGMAGIEEFTVFGAFLGRTDGLKVVEALKKDPQTTIRFTEDVATKDTGLALAPSSFTSWGPTPTLDFKPEIAGVGGNVYSTLNDNRYGSMSGTSMASPNVAGLSSLVLQKYKERFPAVQGADRVALAKTALMNTALIPSAENGLPYLPRQIGAGLAQVDKALDNQVFATVDGKPSVALRQVNSAKSFTVTLTNRGDKAANFELPKQLVLGETNAKGETTQPKEAKHQLSTSVNTVSVPAGGTQEVTVTLTPNTAETGYVEGWVKFKSTTAGQPDLAVPYLGFVGDWSKEQIVLKPGEEYPTPSPAKTELVTSWWSLQVPLVDDGETFWVSPNGDNVFDQVTGRVALLRNAVEMRYEIVDGSGKVITVLGSERNFSRLPISKHAQAVDASQVAEVTRSFDGTIWNPQTAQFEPLPDGQYTYRVSARMGDDQPWQNVDMPFGIDTVAPTIKIGELEGDTITFEVSDDKSGLLDEPTVVNADGTKLDAKKVGEGKYEVKIPDPNQVPYIRVTALDHGGNLGKEFKLISNPNLVVPAAAQLNDPANAIGPKSQNVKDGKLVVEANVSTRVGKVVIGGVEAKLEDQVATAEVPLQEGRNEIEVVAYDKNGQELEKTTLTPYYDLTPPTLKLDPKSLNENGKAVIAEDGTITISGVAKDERPGAKLTVMVDGEEPPVNEDGTFTGTFTPVDDQGTVTISVSDGANSTSQTVEIEGRVEPEEEESEWIGPNIKNADCLKGYTACFINGETEGTSADGSTFTLRGETNGHFGSITFTPAKRVGADGNYNNPEPISAVTADGKWSAELPVKTGINQFRVVIKDDAGKVRIDQAINLYFDVTPPTIHFTDPKLIGGTLFTNQDEVNFAGTASDDGWGYSLAINRSNAIDVFYRNAVGPESNQRDFKQLVKVADGDTLLITFVDSNSNLLTALIPVVKDQKAPEVALEGASEGEHIATPRTLTAKAHDENLASMQVLVNGKAVKRENTELSSKAVNVEDVLVDARTLDDKPAAEALGNAAGSKASVDNPDLSYEFSSDVLKPGLNTITVEATDLAGNKSYVARTVLVDAAPTITVPEDLSLEVYREALLDQDGLRKQIADQVKVTDDLTAKPTVTVLANQPLVEGENEVTIVAVDERGNRTETKAKVKLTLKEVTLTSGDVTAVGTFRSDEELNAKFEATDKDGSGKLVLSTKHGSTGVEAKITLPGKENTQVERVLPNGTKVGVPVTYQDGKLTFVGSADATYILTVKKELVPGDEIPTPQPGVDKPKPQDPSYPIYNDDPGHKGKNPGNGDTAPGHHGKQPAQPGGKLPRTGAEVGNLPGIASGLVLIGLMLVAGSTYLRRHRFHG